MRQVPKELKARIALLFADSRAIGKRDDAELVAFEKELLLHVERSLNPRFALALDRAKAVADQILTHTMGWTRKDALRYLNGTSEPRSNDFSFANTGVAWSRMRKWARAKIVERTK